MIVGKQIRTYNALSMSFRKMPFLGPIVLPNVSPKKCLNGSRKYPIVPKCLNILAKSTGIKQHVFPRKQHALLFLFCFFLS